jgi:hypothetical protein
MKLHLLLLLPCLFRVQHFYHIIDRIMMPPCGTEDECNKRFLVNPGVIEGK